VSEYALSLGSNVGNRLGNIRRAVYMLGLSGRSITAKSGVYETPPWGLEEQPRFLNACVLLDADIRPRELLAAAKDIEREIGRKTRERWGPREIDIDILTCGSLLLAEDGLSIPHPSMFERAFVLVPLSDIADRWKHPSLGATVGEMLAKTGCDGIVRVTSL
jgi:2-amino-4-hydroxy-6-hydroxymethyldihydropteridine diphosphokinase